MSNTVNIRPGVSILSVLRHLNYRHWFALAEFVDNSLESFLRYQKELKKADGAGSKLKVTIELDFADEPTITIRDNAAGIHFSQPKRASGTLKIIQVCFRLFSFMRCIVRALRHPDSTP